MAREPRYAPARQAANWPQPAAVPETVAFELQDVVRQLWRRKLLLAAASLAGLGVASAIAFSLPRTFVAEGQLVVRAEASLAPDSERAFYSTSVNEAAVTTERDVLAARGLMTRVADTLTFPPPLTAVSPVRTAIDKLIRRVLPDSGHESAEMVALAAEDRRVTIVSHTLSTAADKGSSVIMVRGASPDPRFSADAVQSLLTLYMKDRLAAQQGANRNVEVALRERLQQTREEIARSEERVSSLMQQPHLVESSEVPGAARQMTLIGTRLADAQADLASRRATYAAAVKLRDSARGDPAVLVAMLDQGSVSTSDLRRQHTEAQSELARISAEAGPNHPARIAAQAAVAGFAARLSNEGQRLMAQRQAELAGAEQTVAALTSQYAALRQSSSSVSPQLLDLDRERETLQNLRKVAGTVEDRLIAIVAQPVDANARILTLPTVPLMAAFPNKPMFAAGGFLVSFAIASVVVLTREFMKRAKPTVTRQAQVFGGRLLGSLPELRRSVLRGGGVPAMFQAIALEVEQIVDGDGARVITITSGEPKEGKTTVAVSLALALAKMGRRVLLMNCDLHQATDTLPGLRPVDSPGPRVPGVLVDPASGLHLAHAAEDRPSDPVAALHGPEFAARMATARNHYDVVICDTPPVLSVPDALIVGRVSDGFILVAEAGSIFDATLSREIVRRLQMTGQRILGVVATKVPANDLVLSSYSGYPERPGRSMMKALATSGMR